MFAVLLRDPSGAQWMLWTTAELHQSLSSGEPPAVQAGHYVIEWHRLDGDDA